MSKQIKIDFVLEIEDKTMTPNILTPLLTNLFNSQGWEYKGIVENIQQYDNEINLVRVNYGKQ